MKYSHNLSTRSYVNRRALYIIYAFIAALLVVALTYNVLRFFSLQTEMSRNEANKVKIEDSLMARSGVNASGYDATSYQKLLSDIQAANDILKRDSFHWTALLDRMELLVPRDVRILKIDPDHSNQTIKLSGHAKTLKALRRFIDNLIKSGHYTHVFIQTQSSDPETKVIRFSINLEGGF
jgi:type IV pilus assembly protein PilN